jgi:hypothetical protein
MKQQAVHPLAALVASLAEAAELDDAAKALVEPTCTPRDYIRALAAASLEVEAIKFLAHLLPRREAVWWAWMCARSGTPPGDSRQGIIQALAATESWIREPAEKNRRAAFAAAESATLETAAGCAALAAFLSGGSMAPAGIAEVPPPPFGTSRAVFGSLVLSAVSSEPERGQERLEDFLAKGLELAERIKLWESLERTAANPPAPA